MSAALESILEVLKIEAETQVRTEYENEVQRLRLALDETQQALEEALAEVEVATNDYSNLDDAHHGLLFELAQLLKKYQK